MPMQLLDGKVCADHLVADISEKVAGYVESGLRKPHMTIILMSFKSRKTYVNAVL